MMHDVLPKRYLVRSVLVHLQSSASWARMILTRKENFHVSSVGVSSFEPFFFRLWFGFSAQLKPKAHADYVTAAKRSRVDHRRRGPFPITSNPVFTLAAAPRCVPMNCVAQRILTFWTSLGCVTCVEFWIAPVNVYTF